MLLMVDLLSLRAREYAFLIRMFLEWEVRASWGQKDLCSLCSSVPSPLFLDLQLDVRK